METPLSVGFNVVDAIKTIVSKLEKSSLLPEALECIETPSKHLSEYLDVSVQQAWIFAVVYYYQMMDEELTLSGIQLFLHAESAQLFDIRTDVDTLLTKRLIFGNYGSNRRNRGSELSRISLVLDSKIQDAIYLNQPIGGNQSEPMDIYQFCHEVSELIEHRSNSQFETWELFQKVESIEKNNTQIPVIEHLKKQNIVIGDRTLLYEVCDDYVTHQRGSALERTLSDMYDNVKHKIIKSREIVESKCDLVKNNLLTVNGRSFYNDFSIELTPAAIELLLEEDAALFMTKLNEKNLTKTESIPFKELFFEEKFQKQIEFLKTSLSSEKFESLQNRLQSMSMPRGIAALFYGKPGTGKTETALQIAKATGRNVFAVDISQIKSMWFGESEKRIKDVFNQYKQICERTDMKPILLFNEADAVLGKRKDNEVSNVAQTENAIQNIILEEMEKLQGILIATTNLVDNLDAAFERRFLFKLKFEMPTTEAKIQIWKSKLNWLDDEQATLLANRFNFSGGEIDNVVRKTIMTEVITNTRPTMDEIMEFCNTERLTGKNGTGKVGYN